MIHISQLDFILVNTVCFTSGIFVGLSICAKYKEVFLQRVASKEKIEPIQPIQCEAIKDLNIVVR